MRKRKQNTLESARNSNGADTMANRKKEHTKQSPTVLSPLPFAWSAVRYVDPQTQSKGEGNVAHLRMDEPFRMEKWSKPAGYILCASPVTARDPQHWQPAEDVTCQSCLGRVAWFLERYAVLSQRGTKKK